MFYNSLKPIFENRQLKQNIGIYFTKYYVI